MTMAPILFVLLAAGGAAYVLTRKSEEPAPVPAPLALPPPVVTPRPQIQPLPVLDAGLSLDERLAVQNALTHETIIANLNGFASTFEPMFPMAASVLRMKATGLGAGQPTTGYEAAIPPCCSDCAEHPELPPCTPIVSGQPVTMGLPASLVLR